MKSRFILFFLSFLFISKHTTAQTAPTFSKTTIDASIDEIYDVFPADIDKDGDQDIVGLARNGFGAGLIVWYENDGNASPAFTKITIDNTTNSPRGLFVVDIDKDGDLDIIAVFQIDGFSGATNIFWYENDGASNPSFTRVALGSVKGLARDLDVADIDNDGDLDIAVSDNDGSGSAGLAYESVTWFENDGAADPSFTKRLIDVTYRFAESIRIGDMDGDNDLDIVVGSNHSDDIAWYENNGAADPSFSKNFVDQNALGVEQIELADLDDDGDLDVVWTDNFSDYIAWSRNNGEVNPTFTEIHIQGNYNASALVAVADMDLDGDLDVVSGSFLEDDVYWYESNGAASPTFTRHEIDSLLDQPQRVRIADIDGDGSPDIVGAAFRADDVMWYENSLITVVPRSVKLDGTDDYVSVPNNSALSGLTNISLEAWVFIESTSRQGIFDQHTSPTLGWYLELLNNSGGFRMALITSAGSKFSLSTKIPSLNQWHHFASTYDGTTIKLYLNGEDVTGTNTGTGTGDLVPASRELRIGDLNWTSGNFNGKIDEARIWNDVRTQNEIRDNMFQTLSGSEQGLIGYWKFDEANLVMSPDLSSNSNTASLINGASRSSNNHPYGTFIQGNEGWRMMTAPASGVSYGALLDTLWTQGFTGSDSPSKGTSNVYTWSESAQSFTSISNATDVPASGSGFLVYVYGDDNFDGIDDAFPKIIKTDSTQKIGYVAPSLSYTNTGNSSNDGWNLIGNPYGTAMDWDASSGLSRSNLDASFYVWSDSSSGGAGSYLSWNGSTGTFGGGEIAPWQGFWVKANAASPSLSFTDGIRTTGGILRKQALVSQLGFTLKGEALSSKTILMFSDQSSIEKDELDAWKLQSLNSEYLSLFTRLEDGSGLDINALPFDLEGEVSIPLGFDGSNLNGAFDLTWNPQALPEGMAIVLVDNETGTKIDLTEASSYSFELETKAKAVQTQNIASPRDIASQQGISSPQHLVFSPKVMKAKTSGTRFTIKVNAAASVSNEPGSDLPSVVELDQNYPNPFNPSTTINFAVPEQSNVQLVMFDMLGRKVAELLNERKSAGRYSINFDASQLASGLYLYRLQVGSSVLTKKMTLIK